MGSFFKKFFQAAVLFLLVFPCFAHAGVEISATPSIISEKTEKPGILEYDISLENTSDNKQSLYVIVRDVLKKGEKEYKDPSELPMSASLARWIKIERGVIELESGDKRSIPLKINIPSKAEAGVYHAAITFARGSNRPRAEKAAREKNEAKTIVNIEVVEHKIKKAEVSQFSAGGSIIANSSVDFSFKISNIGNKEIAPKGEVVVYDKSGRIVDSLPVPDSGALIGPDDSRKYSVSWDAERRFGKLKAKLMMYYGKEHKDLYDMTTFVLMPKFLLFALGLFIVCLAAGFSFLLLRGNITRQESEEGGDYEDEEAEKEAVSAPVPSKQPPKKEKKRGDYVIDLKSRR